MNPVAISLEQQISTSRFSVGQPSSVGICYQTGSLYRMDGQTRGAKAHGGKGCLSNSGCDFSITVLGTLPWAIGSGGWINERLHLFVIPLLLVVNAFSQNRETDTSWLLDFTLVGSLRPHLSQTCLCNHEVSEFTRVVEPPDHTFGNIRHLNIIPSQFLAQRPMAEWVNYRTPIKNLYLCGAGTYPGGEATGAPGHNNANEDIRRLGERAMKG